MNLVQECLLSGVKPAMTHLQHYHHEDRGMPLSLCQLRKWYPNWEKLLFIINSIIYWDNIYFHKTYNWSYVWNVVILCSIYGSFQVFQWIVTIATELEAKTPIWGKIRPAYNLQKLKGQLTFLKIYVTQNTSCKKSLHN